MRVWIASFLVLFGTAEVYQWVEHFTLPLPIYILGGAFLAIASNYKRVFGVSWTGGLDETTAIPDRTSLVMRNVTQGDENQRMQPPRPISFTIGRSNHERQ